MQQWRDIPGFVGRYQISNDGQVRRLRHSVYSKRFGKMVFYPEKMVKISTRKQNRPDGPVYKTVKLTREKHSKDYYINKLLLDVWGISSK